MRNNKSLHQKTSSALPPSNSLMSLLEDLIVLILQNVDLYDLLQFRAVCRSCWVLFSNVKSRLNIKELVRSKVPIDQRRLVSFCEKHEIESLIINDCTFPIPQVAVGKFERSNVPRFTMPKSLRKLEVRLTGENTNLRVHLDATNCEHLLHL
jgi:hypothetical protein